MLLEAYLLEQASELLNVAPGKLKGNAPISAYGLDSLRAAELTNRIQLHVGVVLSMAHVLEAASLSELVSMILHQVSVENHNTKPDMPLTVDGQSHETSSLASQSDTSSTIEIKSGNTTWLPVSFQQQGLWRLHQEREIASQAYNILGAVRFRGRLDHELLKKSLIRVLERHCPLRTTFSVENGELMQVVRASTPFQLQLIKLSELVPSQREAEVRLRAAQDAQCRFDLHGGPVFRVKLYQLEEENHVLSLIFPHISCDGWSLGIIADEIMTYYEATVSGRSFALSPLSYGYTDFSRAQGERLTAEVLETQRRYWKQKLNGKLPDVIGDWPESGRGSIVSAQERFSFS